MRAMPVLAGLRYGSSLVEAAAWERDASDVGQGR